MPDETTVIEQLPAQTAPTPNAAPREQSLSKPQVSPKEIPKASDFDMSDAHDVNESLETPPDATAPPRESSPSKPPEGQPSDGTEGSHTQPTTTREDVSGQEAARPTAARPNEQGEQEAVDVIKLTKPAGQFDYTGYSAEEAQMLKQMSNQAREKVGAMMKRTKELEKTAREASFLQHPAAYQLDPAYTEMQTDQFFVTKEAEYWKEQLNNIKAGDNWRPVVRWNDDGTPVLGAERPPTGQDEEQVRLAMNECYQKSSENAGKIRQFATTQQQRIQTDLNAINQERARRFEWVADPKLLEHKIDVPGIGVKTVGQLKSDFISMFPSYYRSTAGVDVASDLFVAVQVLSAKLREAEGKKQVAETKADEIRRAEPSSTTRPAGQNGRKSFGGVRTFDLEGMTGL